MVSRWIEITFMLILIYLVLSRAFGFERVVRAVGEVYTSSVKVLQGR